MMVGGAAMEGHCNIVRPIVDINGQQRAVWLRKSRRH
jgi:hypothetical protein